MPQAPLVSIAIPLYRSQRFIPVIVQNIANIGYRNVEILISDRHGEDGAIDALRARLGGDTRVSILSARDKVPWVEHYNQLLKDARGDYFMWMPHDDSFPADYIPKLVSALEAHPEAVLAFGPFDAVDFDGVPMPGWSLRPPPFNGEVSAGIADSLKLLFWGSAISFRGVFRRERAVSRGLYIRPVAHGPDVYWTFALSLTAPFVYVPDCRSAKRYYPESTSAMTPHGVSDVMKGARVARSYIRDSDLAGGDRVAAQAGLAVWQALWVVNRLIPDFIQRKRLRLGHRLLPRALRPGQRQG